MLCPAEYAIATVRTVPVRVGWGTCTGSWNQLPYTCLKIKGGAHGYTLAAALNEYGLTDSLVEPGALYRTLRRLEETGHVVSSWDLEGSGPARRHYTLTPTGEEHLCEWMAVMERLSLSLAGFAADVKSAVAGTIPETAVE